MTIRQGPVRAAATLVWLPLVLLGTYSGQPGPPGALGIAAGVLAAAGWVLLGVPREAARRWTPAGVLATGLGGVALLATVESPTSFACCVYAVLVAGVRLPAPVAVGTLVVVSAGVVAARVGAGPAVLAVLVLVLVAVLLLGMGRRESARRAEERELALAADARASEEHARAAALAERARIARDVHDVLAHSLSALAVQLQGTRLMLQRDGAPPDTVAQVERAQRLAAEGLAEARRAVEALRSEPVDVVAGLQALVAETPRATLEVDGAPDALPVTARETVLRTAQEALTNVRKHAPGASVQVRLAQRDGGTELVVHDHAGPPAPRTPGGNGLVGMAERAALAGAELEAGPVADGWRVRLRLPAERPA
ncbi:hypothetical protein BJF78_25005 [Pseudonocardia sp. CNS-139]|nr:hypothetical protein BJF78_25005 [Pseudonocardia sp. CNS-139]